jgi:hypothetical protein
VRTGKRLGTPNQRRGASNFDAESRAAAGRAVWLLPVPRIRIRSLTLSKPYFIILMKAWTFDFKELVPCQHVWCVVYAIQGFAGLQAQRGRSGSPAEPACCDRWVGLMAGAE